MVVVMITDYGLNERDPVDVCVSPEHPAGEFRLAEQERYDLENVKDMVYGKDAIIYHFDKKKCRIVTTPVYPSKGDDIAKILDGIDRGNIILIEEWDGCGYGDIYFAMSSWSKFAVYEVWDSHLCDPFDLSTLEWLRELNEFGIHKDNGDEEAADVIRKALEKIFEKGE